MKKVVFAFIFLFLILSINFAFAATIETENNYSLGENFVARISGNFYTALQKSNIHFYRNHNSASFGIFSLSEIEGDYFVYFTISPDRTPGNYSIRIEDAQYFVGSELKSDDVIKGFEILSETSFVEVHPALVILENYSYNLTVKNLEPLKINVSYGLEGTSFKSVLLNSGEEKSVSLNTYGGQKFERVLFSYGSEIYPVLIYSLLDEISPPEENETVVPPENPSENDTTDEENESGQSFWDILFGGGNNGDDEDDEENDTEVNESKKNESNGSFWDIFFGKNETNQTNATINNSGNALKTCSELKFKICSSDEKCEGSLVSAKDAQCCNGSCVKKEGDSGAWGTVGWIILGVVVILAFIFFKFKFSRTRRIPSRFR